MKLELGGYVKFNDFPAEIDPAPKNWAGKVIDYNKRSKYPILLEWLEKEWLNGIMYYNITKLVLGDVLKVNAALSPVYFEVVELTEDTMEVKELEEAEVIARFKDEDPIYKLQRSVMHLVKGCEDEEYLRELKRELINTNG